MMTMFTKGRFINAFVEGYPWTASGTCLTQSTNSHQVSLKSALVLSSNLHPELPSSPPYHEIFRHNNDK